ncbi:Cytochrome P450 71B6 [Vitis vinifera]|uniref:Cytochrome P450 71B6 n=1 Tax=Vitis vinifera TaxID=29760 RepID=A0A438G1D0_VITVI|nr:Cytochrome P450 71B6 [Vitis vinifera]
MAMEIAEAVMEVFSPSSVTDWLFTLSVVILSVLCFFLVQKMVIKEAMRKHTPIPLLIPRETMNYFKIQDKSSSREYDIYPETRILVNAWGIGRDPKSWKDPDVFYPERFEDCEIEFYGKHFELLPFGGGKRICPGANMGIEDLGLEEELGGITASRKTPLCLVARRCGCSCTEPM